MKAKIITVLVAFALAPAFMAAEDTFSQRIASQACLVEIFHTNFAFPPEGGRVVQIGSRMYFARDYLPGCENAASQGQVLSGNFPTPTPVPLPPPAPRPNCY